MVTMERIGSQGLPEGLGQGTVGTGILVHGAGQANHQPGVPALTRVEELRCLRWVLPAVLGLGSGQKNPCWGTRYSSASTRSPMSSSSNSDR